VAARLTLHWVCDQLHNPTLMLGQRDQLPERCLVNATLPQAMQAEVDAVFNECDGAWDWEDYKGTLKTIVEHCNCGHASAIAPTALAFVVVVLRLGFT
jgi:hypothetical protein